MGDILKTYLWSKFLLWYRMVLVLWVVRNLKLMFIRVAYSVNIAGFTNTKIVYTTVYRASFRSKFILKSPLDFIEIEFYNQGVRKIFLYTVPRFNL